jgi:CheY-like chemotaxis protein
MRTEPVILLVEDSSDDLRLLQHHFNRAGLREPLHTVSDGVEAMSYLLGHGVYAERKRYPQPNLLLIDINMPRVNGLELMSWLRTQPEFEHLIIVALSSSSAQQDINRAYEMGANSYLIKPVSPDELEKLIHAFCQYWITFNRLPRF